MDTSVSACANFFQYANGGWIVKNPIPPSFSRWGTFSQLAERNNAHVREILEDASKKKAPAGSNDQKMADYYSSCMDEAGIEAAGLKPIEAELNRINAIKDQPALEAGDRVAQPRRTGAFPLCCRAGSEGLDRSDRSGSFKAVSAWPTVTTI